MTRKEKERIIRQATGPWQRSAATRSLAGLSFGTRRQGRSIDDGGWFR